MGILSSLFYKSKSTVIENNFIFLLLKNPPITDDLIKSRVDIWATGIYIKSNFIKYFDVSKHLRGVMHNNDYLRLGMFINSGFVYDKSENEKINSTDSYESGAINMYEVISENLKNDYSKNEELSKEEIIQLGKKVYDLVCSELNKGLDMLPNLETTCYRYLELLDNKVYNGRIMEGDLIMDKSFIASSILRGAGGKSKWYSEFTSMTPGAFFIIEGYKGKYIAPYSLAFNEEEVLFKNNTFFKVTKIICEGENSFFVFIKEVEKPTKELTIKNPFTGNIY